MLSSGTPCGSETDVYSAPSELEGGADIINIIPGERNKFATEIL